MKKIQCIIFLVVLASSVVSAQNESEAEFARISELESWELKFKDDCTGNWEDKWSLDGVRSKVSTTNNGMLFTAGPIAGDDACHGVLWTKQSFEGDVKIEYEYTRVDTQTKYVNILYIQATGHEPFAQDILEWSDHRIIPSMRLYFNNMDALHISYAAFQNDNTSSEKDYVRVRRYPVVNDFSSTEVAPEVLETGMFVPGKTYKIKVIKTDQKLYFMINGDQESMLYSWELADISVPQAGRIGLRHMYTRSARYKNFKIFTR